MKKTRKFIILFLTFFIFIGIKNINAYVEPLNLNIDFISTGCQTGYARLKIGLNVVNTDYCIASINHTPTISIFQNKILLGGYYLIGGYDNKIFDLAGLFVSSLGQLNANYYSVGYDNFTVKDFYSVYTHMPFFIKNDEQNKLLSYYNMIEGKRYTYTYNQLGIICEGMCPMIEIKTSLNGFQFILNIQDMMNGNKQLLINTQQSTIITYSYLYLPGYIGTYDLMFDGNIPRKLIYVDNIGFDLFDINNNFIYRFIDTNLEYKSGLIYSTNENKSYYTYQNELISIIGKLLFIPNNDLLIIKGSFKYYQFNYNTGIFEIQYSTDDWTYISCYDGSIPVWIMDGYYCIDNTPPPDITPPTPPEDITPPPDITPPTPPEDITPPPNITPPTPPENITPPPDITPPTPPTDNTTTGTGSEIDYGFFGNVFNNLKNSISYLNDGLSDGFNGLIGGIIDGFNFLKNGLYSITDGIIDGFNGLIGGITNGLNFLKNGLYSIANGIINGFNGLIGGIIDGFNFLKNGLYSITNGIIDGFNLLKNTITDFGIKNNIDENIYKIENTTEIGDGLISVDGTGSINDLFTENYIIGSNTIQTGSTCDNILTYSFTNTENLQINSEKLNATYFIGKAENWNFNIFGINLLKPIYYGWYYIIDFMLIIINDFNENFVYPMIDFLNLFFVGVERDKFYCFLGNSYYINEVSSNYYSYFYNKDMNNNHIYSIIIYIFSMFFIIKEFFSFK